MLIKCFYLKKIRRSIVDILEFVFDDIFFCYCTIHSLDKGEENIYCYIVRMKEIAEGGGGRHVIFCEALRLAHRKQTGSFFKLCAYLSMFKSIQCFVSAWTISTFTFVRFIWYLHWSFRQYTEAPQVFDCSLCTRENVWNEFPIGHLLGKKLNFIIDPYISKTANYLLSVPTQVQTCTHTYVYKL